MEITFNPRKIVSLFLVVLLLSFSFIAIQVDTAHAITVNPATLQAIAYLATVLIGFGATGGVLWDSETQTYSGSLYEQAVDLYDKLNPGLRDALKIAVVTAQHYGSLALDSVGGLYDSIVNWIKSDSNYIVPVTDTIDVSNLFYGGSNTPYCRCMYQGFVKDGAPNGYSIFYFVVKHELVNETLVLVRFTPTVYDVISSTELKVHDYDINLVDTYQNVYNEQFTETAKEKLRLWTISILDNFLANNNLLNTGSSRQEVWSAQNNPSLHGDFPQVIHPAGTVSLDGTATIPNQLSIDNIIGLPSVLDGMLEQLNNLTKTGSFTNTIGQTVNPALTPEQVTEASEIVGINVGSISDIISAKISTALSTNVFTSTMERLHTFDTTQGQPPKVSIDLNALLGSTSLISGVTSAFPENEYTVIDFAILEDFEYQGYTLIGFLRFLLSMGMIYATFMFIYRKVYPDKVVE